MKLPLITRHYLHSANDRHICLRFVSFSLQPVAERERLLDRWEYFFILNSVTRKCYLGDFFSYIHSASENGDNGDNGHPIHNCDTTVPHQNAFFVRYQILNEYFTNVCHVKMFVKKRTGPILIQKSTTKLIKWLDVNVFAQSFWSKKCSSAQIRSWYENFVNRCEKNIHI